MAAQKKFNWVLFIVLLLFAVLPGIVYALIHILGKLGLGKLIGNGWQLRIVYPAVLILNFGVNVLMDLEYLGLIIYMWVPLLLAGLMIWFSILGKKRKLYTLLYTIFLAICVGFNCWMIFYNIIPLICIIFALIGIYAGFTKVKKF